MAIGQRMSDTPFCVAMRVLAGLFDRPQGVRDQDRDALLAFAKDRKNALFRSDYSLFLYWIGRGTAREKVVLAYRPVRAMRRKRDSSLSPIGERLSLR
jgi:hypothetical protein